MRKRQEGAVVRQLGLANLGQQPQQQEETPVFVQLADRPDIARQAFRELFPLAPRQGEAEPERKIEAQDLPVSCYGLALALGGGEVTMEELAGLYGMLANQGRLRPVRTAPYQPRKADEGTRMLSPEAAFITLDMLRRNPRPDEDGAPAMRGHWPVAWKTGTSWGFRDAWSAGVGQYVLVVWIGEFSGKGNPSFVGIDAAAPLFFRIADGVNFARAGAVASASAAARR